jgi:hypothetical protein
MVPVVTYPDAVTLALPYLRTALDDSTVTVAASVPNPRPARLVVLRRAGGTDTVSHLLDRPRIDIQAWAATEHDALHLADLARAHLLAAPGRVTGVSRATTFAGPIPIPDDASGAKRALCSVELQVKGQQQ